MKITQPFHFLGQVQFRVEKGSILINGRIYESSSDNWTFAFSPRSTALLAFEPLAEEVEVEFRTVENGLEGLQACQPGFSNIFTPDPESLCLYEEAVRGFFVLKAANVMMGCGAEMPPVLRVSAEWKAAWNDVISSVQSKAPVILICGHRKVGKSSFSRFLTNCLLNRCDAVDFVDLDPGQTEFTPAGFVARRSLDKRDGLLGPPFTHMRVPEDGIYLASSNGSEAPLIYCRSMDSIKSRMNGDYQRPVVINTMGWMTGLGLEFVQYAMHAFSPTHVFAFMALEGGGEDVIQKCLITSAFGREPPVSAAKTFVRYMGNPVNEGAKGKHSPADQRNLAYWAYFFSESASFDCFNFNRQLSSMKPLVVPLAKIQLACPSREIDLYDLIRGTVQDGAKLLESCLLLRTVGLAMDEEFKTEFNTELNGRKRWCHLMPNGKVLKRVSSMRCFGLGLVRTIVPTTSNRINLHIITPLPLPIVSSCNTLVFGSQQIPHQMLAADVMSVRSEAPGFSTQITGTDVIGSASRKTRHNMRRR